MFVHSVWAQAAAPLPVLAEQAGQLLGLKFTLSERSAELPVLRQADKETGSDARWRRLVDGANPPGEIQPLRLFAVGPVIGIASVNPSLNFWLRDRIGESTPIQPLRLQTRPVPHAPFGWRLSAVHLQQPVAGTELILQGGGQEYPEALLYEASLLGAYNLTGIGLTDQDGRMMTLYDEGQLWLQQFEPEDIPSLIEAVVLPLLSME
jgi:hypothetical protein